MTRESVLQQLQESVPEFCLNPEWIEELLGFPAINDFARFICSEAEACRWDEVRKSALFLERGLTEGDDYVRDLVCECLETLSSCRSIGALQGYLGPKSLALWKDKVADNS